MKTNHIMELLLCIIAGGVLVIAFLLAWAFLWDYLMIVFNWIDANPTASGAAVIIFACCVIYIVNRNE
jgi:ABC-type antimicrobial peptide transport system permease subunit